MRITQNKPVVHEKPEPKVEAKDGEEEEGETVKEATQKVVLSVSGAIARVWFLNLCFTEANFVTLFPLHREIKTSQPAQ